jgi:hypothetical protein
MHCTGLTSIKKSLNIQIPPSFCPCPFLVTNLSCLSYSLPHSEFCWLYGVLVTLPGISHWLVSIQRLNQIQTQGFARVLPRSYGILPSGNYRLGIRM